MKDKKLSNICISSNFSYFLFTFSFSEGTLEPYPYLTNLSDLFQKAEKYEDITTQPSSLSSALVPVYDKRWQFNEKKIDSKLIISSPGGLNLDEEDRKLIMTMKEERHRMKLEILKIQKETAQHQLMNIRN